MNKFLLVALLLGFPVLLTAQVTNEGFEEWELQGETEILVGWNNSYSGVGKDVAPYSGESAVTVWNWYSYAIGYVMSDQSGQTKSFMLDQGGVPIDYVPEKLTGYYKFDRGDAPDSAFGTVVLLFRRYNAATGGSDTVSFIKQFLPPSAGWQRFDISIPRPAHGVLPDTMVVGFFSTDPTLSMSGQGISCGFGANFCCYLSIDEVALVNSSGVSRSLQSFLAPMQAVPNPVTDAARLRFDGEPGKTYRVAIYDASGRLALEREISGSSVDLSGFELPSGAYHASVADPSGAPVAAGRFVVE